MRDLSAQAEDISVRLAHVMSKFPTRPWACCSERQAKYAHAYSGHHRCEQWL